MRKTLMSYAEESIANKPQGIQLQMSLEGIFDSLIGTLKAAFKDKSKAPGDEEFNGYGWKKELSGAISKTLGNKAWVTEHFKEEQHPGEAASKALSYHGKIPESPMAAMREYTRLLDAHYAKYAAAMKTYGEAVEKLHDDLEHAPTDKEGTEAALVEAAKKLQALKLPFPDGTKLAEGFGGQGAVMKNGWLENYVNQKSLSTNPLPKLTVDDVVRSATLLLEFMDHCSQKFEALSFKGFNIGHGEGIFERIEHDSSNAADAVTNMTYYQGTPGIQQDALQFYHWDVFPVARALAAWLRSAVRE